MLEMPGKVTLEHNRPLAAPMFHPLEPIVTVSLGSRVQARGGQEKAWRRRETKTDVEFSGWAVPPRGGGRKAQWVRGATKILFTLVIGEINLFLSFPCCPVLTPPNLSPFSDVTPSCSPPTLGTLRGGSRLPLCPSGQPAGAHDRPSRPTKELKWSL